MQKEIVGKRLEEIQFDDIITGDEHLKAEKMMKKTYNKTLTMNCLKIVIRIWTVNRLYVYNQSLGNMYNHKRHSQKRRKRKQEAHGP